ncbi:hypothetical protein EE612_002856, partial [Oryza sativa]
NVVQTISFFPPRR